jgi:hypothetical protein
MRTPQADGSASFQRTKEHLMLSSEHRSAPGSASIYLELVATNAATTHLEVVGEIHDEKEDSLKKQVLALLAPDRAMTRTMLPDLLAVKNERLGAVLESLEQTGEVRRTPGGWQRPC